MTPEETWDKIIENVQNQKKYSVLYIFPRKKSYVLTLPYWSADIRYDRKEKIWIVKEVTEY